MTNEQQPADQGLGVAGMPLAMELRAIAEMIKTGVLPGNNRMKYHRKLQDAADQLEAIAALTQPKDPECVCALRLCIKALTSGQPEGIRDGITYYGLHGDKVATALHAARAAVGDSPNFFLRPNEHSAKDDEETGRFA